MVVIDHDLSVETRFWRYFIYSTVIPIIISVPPYVLDYYGPTDAWCWIVEEEGAKFFVGGALRLF
jgi:hypothetical protein